MQLDELTGKYARLRSELDAAYAAPVWDTGQINRIADELAPLELQLAAFSCTASDDGGTHG